MMVNSVELAKKILSENAQVLYGIFGQIESSGYFPPQEFLNEFLIHGSDPCDQDGRMNRWIPFTLSAENYEVIKEWWIRNNPGTIENSLGVNCWDDWIQVILNP